MLHNFRKRSRDINSHRNHVFRNLLSTQPNAINRADFNLKSTYFNLNLNLIRPHLSLNQRYAKQIVNILDDPHLEEFEDVLQRERAEAQSSTSIDGQLSFSELYHKQVQTEDQQHQKAVNDYIEGLQTLLKLGKGTGVKHFRKVLLSWYEPLVLEIVREVELIRNRIPGVDRNCYGVSWLYDIFMILFLTPCATLYCINILAMFIIATTREISCHNNEYDIKFNIKMWEFWCTCMCLNKRNR